MGRFKVKQGSQNITSGTRVSKRWKLFQYLLTEGGTPVARERLIQVLDLEKNQDSQGTLNALVYRLRQDLKNGEEETFYITYRGKAYAFNEDSKYWWDAEDFEQLCQKTQRLIEKENNKGIETMEEAIELYGGDYLEENETEEWLWSARNYYKNLLIDTVRKLDRFMKKQGSFKKLWTIYQEVLEVVPFEVDLISGSIQTLINSGKSGLAKIEYEEAVNILKENNLKIPSPLKRIGPKVDNIDPETVIKSNSSGKKAKGAYICEAENFTEIYNWERKKAERNNIPKIMLHLKISSAKDLKKNTVVEIKQILARNLRSRDVVCHWKPGILSYFWLI